MYCLDLRSKDIDHKCAIHASGKVTSIDFHPLDSNLMMTAGNDHFCKLFDIRMLRPSISTSTCEPSHLDVRTRPIPRLGRHATPSPLFSASKPLQSTPGFHVARAAAHAAPV